MRTIMIYKGLPGSGKSTEAAALVKKEPKRWVRINRDDLRGMVVGPGNNPHQRNDDRENLVRTFKLELARKAMQDGFDVIFDDTHLVPTTVKGIHRFAESIGDIKIIERGVNVSIEDCIVRDAKRTGFANVGEKIIRDMARGAGLDRGKKLHDKEEYYPPRDGFQVVEQDESLPEAILCDLDGTLAIIGDRSPYDAAKCDMDKPNWPVIKCVLAMHARGVKVIFMSGREDKFREPTIRFIEQWCQVNSQPLTPGGPVPAVHEVIPYELHMRGTSDQRKDSIVKTELFEANVAGKYNVLFILDDRNQVVDNWRAMGLTTFQVAPGNF